MGGELVKSTKINDIKCNTSRNRLSINQRNIKITNLNESPIKNRKNSSVPQNKNKRKKKLK